ncbi:hypothetical protein VCHENC02_4605, partial [Vibrio harveyi]
ASIIYLNQCGMLMGGHNKR